MAIQHKAIGRERLVVLRGVLERAARRAGISRGSKEHEELAARLLQLADVISDSERLVEILAASPSPHIGANASSSTVAARGAL